MRYRLGSWRLLLLASIMLLACTIRAALLNPLDEPPRLEFLQEVLEKSPDQNYCNPTGIIGDSCCDFETVERINDDLSVKLRDLVRTDFFKYYKLNLYKECPFWNENGFCNNRACAVETVEDTDLEIPEMWRSEALGALHTPPPPSSGLAFEPYKQCEFKEQDFCVVEDEATSEGTYVNLLDNPERFTGYSGESAARIWKSIYEENCFNIVHRMDPSRIKSFATSPTSRSQLPGLLQSLAEPIDGGDGEEVCLEKRVYYRLISGLHSSISIHICDEYLNQTTGEWSPNLDCFITRIGAHPERLPNLYFDYVVLLRAISKMSDYLKSYEFCTGQPEEDVKVKKMVHDLVNTAVSCPHTFDEKLLFSSPESMVLKEEFKNHFRNVSRIMDCIGCDKCRLWGKLQFSGLGTALKVLFSYDDEYFNPRVNRNLLTRSEIVALFNTFNRVSESVKAVGKFRAMYQERVRDNNVKIVKVTEAREEETAKESGAAKVAPPIAVNITAAESEPQTQQTKPAAGSRLPNDSTTAEGLHQLFSTVSECVTPYFRELCRVVVRQLETWNIPVPVLLKIPSL